MYFYVINTSFSIMYGMYFIDIIYITVHVYQPQLDHFLMSYFGHPMLDFDIILEIPPLKI
jgi:hypothetical protein